MSDSWLIIQSHWSHYFLSSYLPWRDTKANNSLSEPIKGSDYSSLSSNPDWMIFHVCRNNLNVRKTILHCENRLIYPLNYALILWSNNMMHVEKLFKHIITSQISETSCITMNYIYRVLQLNDGDSGIIIRNLKC